MPKEMELKIGSTIYGKIQAARMSESERRLAIHAMQQADAIANVVYRAVTFIEHLGARLFYRPTLKH